MWSKTVRFQRFTAYSGKKWNFVFSEKLWSEKVQFWPQRGIRKNLFMSETFKFNFINFSSPGP
jgi:hypothetical protein